MGTPSQEREDLVFNKESDMTREIQITVNGQFHRMELPETRTLADFLRDDLKLTGTKIGCSEAECGICTVLVDGTPVNSCIYPVFKANGKNILTIEGLAQDGQLHPIQNAFLDHGAVQCGFCTPGLIMTAKALLDEDPDPDDEAIKHAFKDTICRCTGYAGVIDAIHSAASELRGEAPIPPAIPTTSGASAVIGTSVHQPKAVDKVTGKAMYARDYTFPGMLFARTRRADHPHAKILKIDTSRAKALPGVAAVLTHEDIPGENIHGLIYLDWPCLAGDKTRYMGDAIAIVAAETIEIANRALSLIDIEYQPLPIVPDPVFALSEEAPIIHEGWKDGNLLKHIKVRHGDVEKGFAEADVIIENTYQTPTIEHAFMEPECAIGVPAGYDADHDKLTVYVGSQIPYQDREQVARILGLPEDAVRIRGTLIGGGFGGKEDLMGQAHVALLAQVTGRPVRMQYSRQESLLVHPKRHATRITIKTGAKKDGTLTAVQATLYGDTGAYASLGDKVLTRATTHATGPYEVPNAKIDCFAMYTNNPPSGAFRGFGVTQSAFAVESNMDQLAATLGMDPLELRLKNAQRVGSVTATGQLLDNSVGLIETIENVRRDMGHDASDFRWTWREGNKACAWGIACAYKNTGLGGGAPDKSSAIVEAFEDGRVRVRTSAADMGQGIGMVVAMAAAEELGVPYDRVDVLLSDTDLTPDAGPTTASRQTFVTGNAARLAAGALREALTSAVAEHENVPPEKIRFEEGLARYEGREISLGHVVGWLKRNGLEAKAVYEYWAPDTKPLGEGGDMHVGFSYATQAALVEVDLETGEVKALKVVSSTDVGKAINPQSVQGQIVGGIVMATGNALTEQYIIEEGVPWSTRFARYRVPGMKVAPEVISTIVEHPTRSGPYGAKGVGELPSINTTPAIANAVANATGVRVFSVPIDQDALLRAMKAGERVVMTTWSDVK